MTNHTQTDPVFAALTVAETARMACRMEERRLAALDLPDAEVEQKTRPFSAAADAADEELLRTDAMTNGGFAAKAAYLIALYQRTSFGDEKTVDECIAEYGPLGPETMIAAIARDAAAMVESGLASKPETVNDRVRHLVLDLENPLTEAPATHGIVLLVANYGDADNLGAMQPVIVTLGDQLAEVRAAFNALHEAAGGVS